MQELIEKIVERLEERTEFLKDCTKYGNKDAKQQEKSYSTMMLYEVADLVDDLIEIVNQVSEQYLLKNSEESRDSQEIEEVCEWEYNRFEDGWQTDCDVIFHLDVSESDLEIVKFCPYCGKKIKVVE